MKKLFALIVTILGIGVSFCSADFGPIQPDTMYIGYGERLSGLNGCFIFPANSCARQFLIYDSSSNLIFSADDSINGNTLICGLIDSYSVYNNYVDSYCTFRFYSGVSFGSSSSSPSSINVLYNNQNSTESIICDGDNLIQIDGLSTITATNTFTPYYNISYIDEDNQSLIESYDHDILYLENGKFKKTYTGSNDRILTVQSENQSFSGYLPSFDVTGSIATGENLSGNVFTNFTDNGLKVLLSNIPSYIQYVIMLLLLFFIIGIIRRFRRK